MIARIFARIFPRISKLVHCLAHNTQDFGPIKLCLVLIERVLATRSPRDSFRESQRDLSLGHVRLRLTVNAGLSRMTWHSMSRDQPRMREYVAYGRV